ncbi:MAG TPA: LLM class flavin-dependent oxidoreductase [Thermoleophilaceae bacterium]|nr:LLM class flavin-dependent oxidoreductase [Thermoleophilaceae bacterium]
MSRARRPLEFGVSIVPALDELDAGRAIVRAAEEGGLDLVGIQDHPYQRRFLDPFSLIATLLAETERLRFFPDVANLPLRPPAMMAKAAATLDRLSGGRFELGLGAGATAERAGQMGGPARSPGEAVSALEEAIQVIRLAWSEDESVSFDGEHYRLEAYEPGPAPAHRIEIWLGAYKPRMLGLTGRLADGWIPSFGYLKPDAVAEASSRIDEAARHAGRDPGAVRRAYNFGMPEGDPAETIASWAGELGLDTFVLWARDAAEAERFAGEVVPAVRAAVGS